MVLLALLMSEPAVASDLVTPNVIVHQGRQTAVFAGERVQIEDDNGAHRVTTPLGTLSLPVSVPGVVAVPGQLWLLNDHVWVEVVGADDQLIEFAVITD